MIIDEFRCSAVYYRHHHRRNHHDHCHHHLLFATSSTQAYIIITKKNWRGEETSILEATSVVNIVVLSFVSGARPIQHYLQTELPVQAESHLQAELPRRWSSARKSYRVVAFFLDSRFNFFLLHRQSVLLRRRSSASFNALCYFVHSSFLSYSSGHLALGNIARK